MVRLKEHEKRSKKTVFFFLYTCGGSRRPAEDRERRRLKLMIAHNESLLGSHERQSVEEYEIEFVLPLEVVVVGYEVEKGGDD